MDRVTVRDRVRDRVRDGVRVILLHLEDGRAHADEAHRAMHDEDVPHAEQRVDGQSVDEEAHEPVGGHLVRVRVRG